MTLAEGLEKIKQIKAELKTAMENGGVTVGSAPFENYPGLLSGLGGDDSAFIDWYLQLSYSPSLPPSPWGDYTNSRVTRLDRYALVYANIQGALSLPNATHIDANACLSSAISHLNAPMATIISSKAFEACNRLLTVTLNGSESIVTLNTSAFANCAKLNTVYITAPTINTSAFASCAALTKLVIYKRTPSESTAVGTLGSTGAFTGTPIASGTGYIYVPDDLVDLYKVKTNWVTYAAQIKGHSEL